MQMLIGFGLCERFRQAILPSSSDTVRLIEPMEIMFSLGSSTWTSFLTVTVTVGLIIEFCQS